MKITVTRGATVNLGSYESSRIDISIEEEIGKEDRAYALTQLDNFLVKELSKRVEAVQEGAGLPPQPVARFFGTSGK